MYDDVADYVLTAPVHELATTESFLRVLDGYETTFAPGERFAYNNGGYVVLALIAERAAGVPFPDLVAHRVCARAGMHSTAFLRSDELPGGAAVGYLDADGLRTNVLHLPVRGTGDGGIYSTVADIHSLWTSFFAGEVVSADRVAEMTRPRSSVPEKPARYCLGFWLHESRDTVVLEGSDAGVSFRTARDPHGTFTHTVISNVSDNAWPIGRHLREVFET